MSLFFISDRRGNCIRKKKACVTRLCLFRPWSGAHVVSASASVPYAGLGRRARRLPRKEVIQPHLPVRLPCYDFTLLTGHTFGAFLPEGLEQRLRVHPTRMV
jgi:hypothetical protein